MKKINSFFKGALAALALLATTATVKADIAEGTFSFSATMDIRDQSIAPYVSDSFDFTVTKKNAWYYTVSGFLRTDYSGDCSVDGDILEFDEYFLRFVAGAPTVAFANANGDYPEYYKDDTGTWVDGTWYLTLTFDAAGNVTIPDFTLVTLNETDYTTTVLAKFTGCKVVNPNASGSGSLPAKQQLAGDYTFKSTLSDVGANYTDYFAAEFDFQAEYTSTGVLRFVEFINSGYNEAIQYDEETGVLTFPQYVDDDWQSPLAFADANGTFPLEHWDSSVSDWVDPWYLTATVDASGKITFPDFTVVLLTNEFTGECEVVARFTNATAQKTDGFGDVVTVDIPGVYTVTGTKLDYTAGGEPLQSVSSFYLTIGESGELKSIAGYTAEDLEVFNEQGLDIGYIEGTYWSLPVYNTYGPAYLEKDGTNGKNRNVVLSGQSTESYQNGSEITLSYTDNAWNLTDFTIWSQISQNVPGQGDTPDKVETQSTLLYAWKDLKVVKGEQELPADQHVFAGNYNFKWYKTSYANPDKPITTLEDMTLSINSANQFTAIGNYTVNPEFLEWGYDEGIVDGDTWTLATRTPYNVIDMTDMATGEGVFVGGPSTTVTNENQLREEEVILSVSNGEISLSDFTIWQKSQVTESGDTDEDGTTGSETKTAWKLLYKWSSTGEVTPDVDTAVEIVENDANAPVEFFNLQGIRVDNPSNGLYIMRQGKTARKVIIRN